MACAAAASRPGERSRSAGIGRTLSALIARLGRLVAPRTRYALWLGAALWCAWLVSLLAGPGLLDLAGNVKGTDFIEFYTAGRIVLMHGPHRLYDLELQRLVEHELTAPQDWPGLHPFINPPFFALLFVPFARLPYLVAFALWSALGLALIVGTVRLVDGALPAEPRRWPRAVPWVLAFVPTFAALSYGQNAALSLFILAATFALLRRSRDRLAGLVLGGLLYKPQLVIVLALVLLLDRRWHVLLGMATAAALLAAVSLAMGHAAVASYVRLTGTFPTMLADPGFPTHKMHSLYAFFVLLLPGHLPVAAALAMLAMLLTFAAVRRLQPPYAVPTLPRWYAVATWGTVLISPHVMFYDLLPLALAGLLCREERRDRDLWLGGVAAIWAAVAFSGPLAESMRRTVGVTLQLSVPVLLAAGYCLLRDAGEGAPTAAATSGREGAGRAAPPP